MKPSFKSRWRRELKEFLQFRQTNFTSSWPEGKVRLFDRFAADHPDLSLPEVIAAWLQRDAKRHPLTIGRDLIAIFLVLYCTGLRIGEALRLRLVDVELGQACFRIGPSKGRVRWVPFGRDLALELKQWRNRRRRAGFRLTPQTPLFEREDGRGDNVWNAGMRLNTLFRRCGLKPKPGNGRGGRRVHDLRHVFTVHRLERGYRAGRDPGPLLPWLSAYLGHVNLLGTQRYLQATAQTLSAASRRFRRSLGFNPATP